jgi:ATP-binding cassette subfamily D (ALD) long-chain fatty acid import protein
LKEINEFAGYTERVSDMIRVFKEVAQGEYKKVTVSQQGAPKSRIIDFSKRGIVAEGDIIRFTNVPIVSPNGDVLVPKLSFEVKSKMHLLISGPNGCGNCFFLSRHSFLLFLIF